MILYEEIFFEFNLSGAKSDIINFINFIKSGDLNDILEITSDHIFYDDDYHDAGPNSECHVVISNDEYGIEMDELDTDELLDEICKAEERSISEERSMILITRNINSYPKQEITIISTQETYASTRSLLRTDVFFIYKKRRGTKIPRLSLCR